MAVDVVVFGNTAVAQHTEAEALMGVAVDEVVALGFTRDEAALAAAWLHRRLGSEGLSVAYSRRLPVSTSILGGSAA